MWKVVDTFKQLHLAFARNNIHTRDEKIDSNLIHNSCKCDANLVVEIGTHCEFMFATIQICTTFGIIFALMRICDKIRNIFAQRCQFEANVCIIYNID